MRKNRFQLECYDHQGQTRALWQQVAERIKIAPDPDAAARIAEAQRLFPDLSIRTKNNRADSNARILKALCEHWLKTNK